MMTTAAITGTVQQLIECFCWMLVHSLWQGLLVALVTAVLLWFNRNASAAGRYLIVLVPMLLFLIGCSLTFCIEWKHWETHPANFRVRFGEGSANRPGIELSSFISYVTLHAPRLLIIWSLLFCLRAARLLSGMIFLQRARHRQVFAPAEIWKERFQVLCRKLALNRAVQLLESTRVQVPLVIGHLKPIVLVPVGMLAAIPYEQVEAILLHELEHIRRSDYLVNTLQTIAEAVFFFNPGFLWLSALLREEREHCCDDAALAQTGSKRHLVAALIAFKEHALLGQRWQTAFPGKEAQLLQRVSRIVYGHRRASNGAEKGWFLAGSFVLLALATAVVLARTPVAVSRHQQQKTALVALTEKPLDRVTIPTYSQLPVKSRLHNSRMAAPVHPCIRPSMIPATRVLRNRQQENVLKQQAKTTAKETAREQVWNEHQQAKQQAKQGSR